jgi:hypothetical protein
VVCRGDGDCGRIGDLFKGDLPVSSAPPSLQFVRSFPCLTPHVVVSYRTLTFLSLLTQFSRAHHTPHCAVAADFELVEEGEMDDAHFEEFTAR